MAVRRCKKEDLRRIARATGATLLLTLAGAFFIIRARSSKIDFFVCVFLVKSNSVMFLCVFVFCVFLLGRRGEMSKSVVFV